MLNHPIKSLLHKSTIQICRGKLMKTKLGEFIEEYSVRNKQNEEIPVYSVTN